MCEVKSFGTEGRNAGKGSQVPPCAFNIPFITFRLGQEYQLEITPLSKKGGKASSPKTKMSPKSASSATVLTPTGSIRPAWGTSNATISKDMAKKKPTIKSLIRANRAEYGSICARVEALSAEDNYDLLIAEKERLRQCQMMLLALDTEISIDGSETNKEAPWNANNVNSITATVATASFKVQVSKEESNQTATEIKPPMTPMTQKPQTAKKRTSKPSNANKEDLIAEEKKNKEIPLERLAAAEERKKDAEKKAKEEKDKEKKDREEKRAKKREVQNKKRLAMEQSRAEKRYASEMKREQDQVSSALRGHQKALASYSKIHHAFKSIANPHLLTILLTHLSEAIDEFSDAIR